ncbi:MAG: PEP-CTERM sorting domain-containing protein [Planctomycetales bacterium]|nr:PEP-CTERM sorting domain-containing protein [Planctomycetales bacterium]
MMKVAFRWFFFTAAASLGFLAISPATTVAQPLINDSSLVFYFPFDDGDFTVLNEEPDPVFDLPYGTIADHSGNGFDGTVWTPSPIFQLGTASFGIDTANTVRGSGAAHIVQSDFPGDDGPVYADLHGEDLMENHPEKTAAATNSVTYAAWVYVPSETGLHTGSVFQGRGSGPNGGSGHGGPHFQLEGDGRFRMVNRDSDGNGVVDAPGGGRWYPDTGSDTTGTAYPLDEWFHIAMTVDSNTGLYNMYYNGEAKVFGFTTGSGLLGDWGGMTEVSGRGSDMFAFGMWAVYDNATSRNFEGFMDEAYVFNRALTAEEIGTLALLNTPGLPGDGNGDGWVDGLDYLLWAGNFGSNPGVGTGPGNGDYNDDGSVDGLDYLLWAGNFGNHASGTAVPEPGTFALCGLGLSMLLGLRRRRNG